MKFTDKSCPFCKKDNNCQVGNQNCWCRDIQVPKELIELVPNIHKRKSCICKNCIIQFKHNPYDFKVKYNLL